MRVGLRVRVRVRVGVRRQVGATSPAAVGVALEQGAQRGQLLDEGVLGVLRVQLALAKGLG